MTPRSPIGMSSMSYIHNWIDDWNNLNILAEFHRTIEN